MILVAACNAVCQYSTEICLETIDIWYIINVNHIINLCSMTWHKWVNKFILMQVPFQHGGIITSRSYSTFTYWWVLFQPIACCSLIGYKETYKWYAFLTKNSVELTMSSILVSELVKEDSICSFEFQFLSNLENTSLSNMFKSIVHTKLFIFEGVKVD